MSGDPTVLSYCPVCHGSVDTENDYVTDGEGEFWHHECHSRSERDDEREYTLRLTEEEADFLLPAIGFAAQDVGYDLSRHTFDSPVRDLYTRKFAALDKAYRQLQEQGVTG